MKKILFCLLAVAFVLPFSKGAIAQDNTRNLLVLPTIDKAGVLSEGMITLFNRTITKAVLESSDNYKVYFQDTGVSVQCNFKLVSKIEELTGGFYSLMMEVVNIESLEVVKTADATFTPDYSSFRVTCFKIANNLFPKKSVEQPIEETASQENVVVQEQNSNNSLLENPQEEGNNENSASKAYLSDTPDYIVLSEINLMVLRTELNAMVPRAAAERQVTTKVGGFDDWRLPTADELYLLYGYKDKLGKMKFQRYWASDCRKDGNGEYTEVWYLLIDEAFAKAEMRKMTKNIRVWQCGVWMVRNIQ